VQLRFVSPAARAPARRSGDAANDASGTADADAADAPPRRKLYLQGDIRVVFPPRRPDEDAEALRVTQDAAVLEAADAVTARHSIAGSV
jgi:hypothetical protein